MRIFVVPTDAPESDGTYDWSGTTVVLVELRAADERGIGWSYADRAAGTVIESTLLDIVRDRDPMDISGAWTAMIRSVRNSGRPGIASCAIAAMDVALWDLKARLLGISLLTLLGAARDRVEVYGSGGFTSYTQHQLERQLSGWAASGIRRVKMKIGRDAAADRERVAAARRAIGPDTALFVDANGAYTRKQALAQADAFAKENVVWFEEPVSSDDLAGLRLIRDRAPAGMDIAAGEYGYTASYFRRMLAAGAVDVLQADATRCGGVTGFLLAAALAQAFQLPLSAHTAPAIHAAPCCAAPAVCHLEYFHDHVRIESMLFDGAPPLVDGALVPDRTRPGLGAELKEKDATPFEIR